ncbi:hypothetical protein AeRB84_000958 [Aphanomyces euteiches]|nr:hypothetical protein AeRB84_000958 [Aphanomyces euteiches]
MEMTSAVMPPCEIDVAILTKELEVAFSEQLTKCTKAVQREMEADRSATIDSILAQVDSKLQTFKQEMMDQIHEELQRETCRSCHSTRSDSLMSHPHDLDDLVQLSLADGGPSTPVDAAAIDAIDKPSLVASFNMASYILQFTRVHGPNCSAMDCRSGEVVAHDRLVYSVGAIADGLKHRGFGVSDVMLMLATKSSLRSFLVVLAVWTLGGSVTLVGSPLIPRSSIMATWACIDDNGQIPASTALPRLHTFSLDKDVAGDLSYAELSSLLSFNPIKQAHLTHPSQLALTIHGSDMATLEPRVSSYAHDDLLVAMESAVASSMNFHGETILSLLPLHSPEALTFVWFPCLYFGSSLHLLEAPPTTATDLAKALRAAKPSVLVTTTTRLPDVCKVHDALACLNQVVCIGASVPSLPRTLRALATLSSKWKPEMKFRRGFGSTTTAGVATLSDALSFPIPPTHVRAMGSALASVLVSVRSLTTGEALGPKQVGELCLSSKIAPGSDGGGSRGDCTLLTHAMVYTDASGQVHGIGSKDGIVNLGTESTTTLELEEVLASHPLVDDAAVLIEKTDPAAPPQLVGFVQLASTAQTYLEDALRSVAIFATKQIPPSKHIHGLVAVREIPRSADGQPFRRQVAEESNRLSEIVT